MALDEFEAAPAVAGLGGLYRDAFDMLSEDFDEEQFGADVAPGVLGGA